MSDKHSFRSQITFFLFQKLVFFSDSKGKRSRNSFFYGNNTCYLGYATIITLRVLPYLFPIGVIMVHFSALYERPCVHQDGLCKSNKLGFPSLRFYKESPEVAKNNLNFPLELSLLQLYRAQRKHRDVSKPQASSGLNFTLNIFSVILWAWKLVLDC